MRRFPRAGYGAALLILTGLILGVAGVAVATLLRDDPALQVNVFGVAGRGDHARSAARDIRAAGRGIGRGFLPGDLGLPAAFRPPTGPLGPVSSYPGWTTLGLDVGQSALLDRARRLGQGGHPAAALALYDTLLRAQPANLPLAVERARLLSLSGNPRAAGEALSALLPRDPALRLEAARNLYWAADFERADGLLEDAPGAPAAALRDSVRRSDTPSVARASRWVRQRDGAAENLALARAWLRERQPASSLAAFRAALRAGGPDSLRLELASAALQADSPALAASALQAWLQRHPADRAARLQRARALAWARNHSAAAEEYARVLQEQEDPALRYELAEAQSWAGDSLAARANLQRVVAAQPGNARAWRLLGDLERWAGHWSLSLAHYQRARELDPRLEGIEEGMSEDRAGVERLRQARLAGLAWAEARAEGMGDSEGFRWSALEGSRQWVRERDLATLAVRTRVEQQSGSGPRGEGGSGVALALEAGRPLSATLHASAAVGAEAIAERVQPTAALQLAYARPQGVSAALALLREPAVRRTATAAAVQAGVSSTRLEGSAALPLSPNTVLEGSAGVERLGAAAGSSERMEASLSAGRALTPSLRLALSASGLTTSRAAPQVEGRSLYWSPRRYLQAQLAASLRRPLGREVELTVRAAPGVAWVDERTLDRRFARGGTLPALAAGGELRYAPGPWALTGALEWSAVGEHGYRSTAARLWLSRAVRVR